MSAIIRDAIIRLKLEQVKSKLEAPDARAFQEVEKAAREAAASIREVGKASKEWSQGGGGGGGGGGLAAPIKEAAKATDTWAVGIKKVNDEWRKSGSGRDSWGEGLARRGAAARKAAEDEKMAAENAARAQEDLARKQETATRQMIGNFREGGEGALRMARGIAFLSANGSQDLQKLVQHVALAQGAFDIFAGGSKMFTNLAAVIGGPYSAALAGTTALLAMAVVQYQRYAREAEAAEKKVREEAEKTRKVIQTEANAVASYGTASRRLASETADRTIANAPTPEMREARSRQEINRLRDEERRLRETTWGGRGDSDLGMERIGIFLRKNMPRENDAEFREAVQRSPDAAKRMIELNRDLAGTLEKRRMMERDLLDQEMVRGKAQVSAVLGGGGAAAMLGGIGAVGLSQGVGTLGGQLQSHLDDFVKKTVTALDEVTKAAEGAAAKANRIQRELDQGNPQ